MDNDKEGNSIKSVRNHTIYIKISITYTKDHGLQRYYLETTGWIRSG